MDSGTGLAGLTAAATVASRRRTVWLLCAVAAAAAAALAATALPMLSLDRRPRVMPLRPMRFEVTLPPEHAACDLRGYGCDFARRPAVRIGGDGGRPRQLVVRDMASTAICRISGTEGGLFRSGHRTAGPWHSS